MSFKPPSQSVLRPRARWSLTPQVRILLSLVRATQCMPPVAIWTTPTVFASRRVLRRGRLTSTDFFGPRPSSPALPSPHANTTNFSMGATLMAGSFWEISMGDLTATFFGAALGLGAALGFGAGFGAASFGAAFVSLTRLASD